MKPIYIILLCLATMMFVADANSQSGWFRQSPDPVINSLYDVCFVDASHGWIAGGNILLKTTDGGENWIGQTIPPICYVRSVAFADAQNGVAVGDLILRTSDGGDTWVSCPLGGAGSLYDICFIDENCAVAVGYGSDGTTYGGIILRTTDRGNSWTSHMTGTNGMSGVCFADAKNGTAVGDEGTILRSTDGGKSWMSQTCGVTVSLLGVFIADSMSSRIRLPTSKGSASLIQTTEQLSVSGMQGPGD
jgi:photosystem II stability/assembly factor-like uncharacterized protein